MSKKDTKETIIKRAEVFRVDRSGSRFNNTNCDRMVVIIPDSEVENLKSNGYLDIRPFGFLDHSGVQHKVDGYNLFFIYMDIGRICPFSNADSLENLTIRPRIITVNSKTYQKAVFVKADSKWFGRVDHGQFEGKTLGEIIDSMIPEDDRI